RGKPRKEREECAQRPHDCSRDQRHVQARDRNDMINARTPHRLVDVLRDTGSHADHERGSNLAFRPADMVADALGNTVANVLDLDRESNQGWCRYRSLDDLWTAQEKPA